ncbi:hypothetical protein J6590_056987 [Homalodisca vitripennis]|nr:hypothetical protein J6590_056987 [Homalodisca vitripennis]
MSCAGGRSMSVNEGDQEPEGQTQHRSLQFRLSRLPLQQQDCARAAVLSKSAKVPSRAHAARKSFPQGSARPVVLPMFCRSYPSNALG